MSTKIEWTRGDDGTAGKTWNPVRGCSIVSPGCVNCYAMKQAHRFSGPGRAYHGLTKLTGQGPQWTGTVVCDEAKLLEPLSWRKPARVFVNSMSDLFHEEVPDAFIERVFSVMALAERHTFQILTKRADRMRTWFAARRFDVKGYAILQTEKAGECMYAHPWPLPNVWLGVSCENQQTADERIPILLDTPAAVRFVSAEPLLGPIDFRTTAKYWQRLPEWVIVGGESGPGARPFELAWGRSIVQQCQSAGVPVFVKQLGAHVRGSLAECLVDRYEMPGGEWRQLPVITIPAAAEWVQETRTAHVGGRLFDRKGGDPSEWPADLRVRQWPESR